MKIIFARVNKIEVENGSIVKLWASETGLEPYQEYKVSVGGGLTYYTPPEYRKLAIEDGVVYASDDRDLKTLVFDKRETYPNLAEVIAQAERIRAGGAV